MAAADMQEATVVQENPIFLIPWSRIRPKQDQPRRYFNKERLEELGDSIQEGGQLVSVIVRRIHGNPDHDFEIIDGERRWRMCKEKNRRVRVEVREVVDDDEHFLMSVVANFGREEHTLMETAHAVERARTMKGGKTLAQVAKTFAHSVPWVSQRLNLLRLEASVQQRLEPETPENEQLNLSLATLLVPLPHNLQVALANVICKRGMNARQAKQYIRVQAKEQGFTLDPRGRHLTEEYTRLASFLGSVESELDDILGLPMKRLEEVFYSRSESDQQWLVERAESCLNQFAQLKEVFGRLKVQRGKVVSLDSRRA